MPTEGPNFNELRSFAYCRKPSSSGAEHGPPKTRVVRQVRGPEVTHADCCTLVFDTDTKSLYVEREVTHLDACVNGAIEMQTATMDVTDYLKQGGQTAGHRELWRLLRTLFKDTDEPTS